MIYFLQWLSRVVGFTLLSNSIFADPPAIDFQLDKGRLIFIQAGGPRGEFVWQDEKISRPYFANLRSAAGVPLTRPYPPKAGYDRMDHPEFHPGLWMAFGDLNGADCWRLKTRVSAKLVGFPQKTSEGLNWVFESTYFDAQGIPFCTEKCRIDWWERSAGTYIRWDSTFISNQELRFGDQQEMGLGVRLATPLRVEREFAGATPGNGEILDAFGRMNEKQIGGQQAEWVNYHGTLEGVPAGVALFDHPGNFSKARYHARDYGYIAVNAFGHAAFDLGPPVTHRVPEHTPFRLRYGVLLHSGKCLSSEEIAAARDEYLQRYDRLRAPSK